MASSSERLVMATMASLLIVLSSCKDDPSKIRMHPGFGDAGTLAEAPISETCSRFVKRASAAASSLSTSLDDGTPDRRHYLALRQAVAAGRPFFSLRSELASEVLLGPPRSLDEAGGALGQLDVALREGDLVAAREALVPIDRALRLITHDIALHRIDPKAALEALSTASFDLGLVIAEAYPGVPDGGDAVMADLLGTLEGIEAVAIAAVAESGHKKSGAEALATLEGTIGALRQAFAAAGDAHELTGRAHLIVATGPLGVAARKLARALGVSPKLPYPARRPTRDNQLEEPIHALVVPAPWIDLRGGDRKAMVALGEGLFQDPRLSGDGKRACVDCHLPAHAFGGKDPAAASLDPRAPLLRNTPPLLYTSLHAAQLWDGRFASAERQALRVIHATSEMGLSPGGIADLLARDETLAEAFRAALGRPAREEDLARALVAYEIEALVPAESPLDRFARGETPLPESMHEGFDVFVGQGRCARCHVPPLFGGSRPPDFSIAIHAVIGVPVRPGSDTIDPDEGRGAITKRDLDRHAFKTPTVRNAAVTAPFFHHGAFPTLEEVVDFYDGGGGRALGMTLDNQDPDIRPLKLGEAKKKLLVAFMRDALRDPSPSP